MSRMTMEHARALAMACQLHSLLGELNEKPARTNLSSGLARTAT